MDDNQIIKLFFERDEQAIVEISQTYGSYCHTIAMNILNNKEDAEECVNDTWIKSWNSIPPQKPVSLKTYVGRILRNTAINLYHHKKAAKRYQVVNIMLDDLSECISASSTIDDIFDQQQLSETISRWLRSLPEKERHIFIRRYWYGDSVQTLAEEYYISANAMTSRLKRLRAKLRIYLEQEGVRI